MDSEAARDDIKLKRELYSSLAGIKCLVKVEASSINKGTPSMTQLMSSAQTPYYSILLHDIIIIPYKTRSNASEIEISDSKKAIFCI